ncbi:pentatricopeptide repeat-containing protein At2g29760, chloroplastic-like [Magnolia sinica]|uniref:pentatricopeptide repeat-containing protein At2g29760, chloroplastic-like n=1 Tax=Magnolia sinica TaxID=86752 RepID=UPI002659EF79|nr:pentatricopeptide repeat-containing protein At2g29760, chloroplastic-like [Magnolia sinica]
MHSVNCISKLTLPKRLCTTNFCTFTPPQIPKFQEFLLLLNQCTSLKRFNQIHAHITTSGLHRNPFIVGKLVEISAVKLPPKNNMAHAMLIFTHSHHPPNLFTWNTIIRGFSLSNTPHHALLVLVSMLRQCIETESFTFAFALKACARAHAMANGKTIHGLVIKSGHGSHIFVVNTAMHVYSACGDMAAARKVFDEMGVRNVVTWNAMIAGYVQNSLPDEGLRVFDRMWSWGIRPNDVTMVVVLSACAQKKELGLGRQVHAYMDENRSEFDSNVNVGTALLDMYAKCKCMDSAKQVFDEMRNRDIGTWNALIGGYVFNSCFSEALELFHELQAAGLHPDEPTLVSTLCACTRLGALDVGKKIHSYAEEKRFSFNVTLGTALVDMYSKCGCINGAREVFDRMTGRDVMAWTSMIGGLAVNGYAKDALELFSVMQESGPRPDGITFVGVLCACSHAGLVDQGLAYFESMRKDYHIVPKIEHYGCIIDLLSRAGRVKEAFWFICSMEIQPNAIIWRTLLSACRLQLNVELAEIAVKNLFELQSDHCGDYVLLSNIYASTGRWDKAEKIREQMEVGGIRKMPGLSLIETDSKVRIETEDFGGRFGVIKPCQV